jgi:hypothetical protein
MEASCSALTTELPPLVALSLSPLNGLLVCLYLMVQLEDSVFKLNPPTVEDLLDPITLAE